MTDDTSLSMLLRGDGGSFIFQDEHSRLEDEGVFTEKRKPAPLLSLVPGEDIFLWEQGEQRVLSKLLPVHSQGTKDCVSHAWATGLQDWTLCKFGAWLGEISTEVLYGGSRVQIGENKLKQPGTCCAWVAALAVKCGIIIRASYPGYDLSKYDVQLAIKFGLSGIPPELLPQLSLLPRPLTTEQDLVRVGKLHHGKDAWDSIGYYSPVPFASKKGFAMARDKNGICDPVGEWNHSQVVRGRCTVKGGRQCLAVQNSVGDYLGDTNQIVELDSGREVKLPSGVYLVDMEVFDDICRNEDAYVIF